MVCKVPSKLVGAWLRESFEEQGAAPTENTQVIWLQTAKYYADVRISMPQYSERPESFGGSVSWGELQLCFNHDIDLDMDDLDEGDFDIGRISWDGEVLVEDATFTEYGEIVSIKERWLRQTPKLPKAMALEFRNAKRQLKGIAIQVAEHAVVIIEEQDVLTSAYFTLNDGVWIKQWGVGETPVFEFPVLPELGECYQINNVSWQCVDLVNEQACLSGEEKANDLYLV